MWLSILQAYKALKVYAEVNYVIYDLAILFSVLGSYYLW